MNAILAILTAVINSLWQAAALAALVRAVLRFWPRTNAATRYAIWWAALAVVLVLPIAPRWIAAVRLHTVTASPKAAVSAPATAAVPDRVELFVIPAAPRRAARWPIAVLAIWLALLAWRFYQIVRSYLYLRRVKRQAAVSTIPLPNIPRRADLLISRDIASPMALGFLKPAVVLPESLLDQLSDAEREHVLLHEAAHLARRDDWSNLATRILAGALALHPVALWILHRIDREREIACDEWVVSRTGAARSYAKSLARLFDLLHGRGTQMLASGICGNGSTIGDRIEALLERGRPFSFRISSKRVIAGAVVLGGFMIGGALTPRWIAFAQEQTAPSFEVASIKPDNSSGPGPQFRLFPGFTVKRATLKDLITMAYDVRDFQVSGGPGWMNSERYSIEAKAERTPAFSQEYRMLEYRRLQTLLKERFRLNVHRETKEFPVYELTVAKGGPKLSPPNCLQREPGDLSVAPGKTMMDYCGSGGFTGSTRYEASNGRMADLAGALSFPLGRIVIDKTGVAGRFRIRLTFAPSFPDPAAAAGPDDRVAAPTEASGPDIFTALQEQLGLKLAAAKGPVEVLVIDHAEKPDAN